MKKAALALIASLAPAGAGAECTFEHLEKIAAFHGTVITSERLAITQEGFDDEVVSEKKASCPAVESDATCTDRLQAAVGEIPGGQRVEVEIAGGEARVKARFRREGVEEKTSFFDDNEAVVQWLMAERDAGRDWMLMEAQRATLPSIRIARVRVLKKIPVLRTTRPAIRTQIATKDPPELAIKKLQATTNGVVFMDELRVDDEPRIDGRKFLEFVLRCPSSK